jgi:hypothetical protein
MAALMMVDGVPPVARVVFGEPKPGLLDFTRLIAGIAGRSYSNGDSKHHDWITDLPLSFYLGRDCWLYRCVGPLLHRHRLRALLPRYGAGGLFPVD